jgi:hypothetical protein
MNSTSGFNLCIEEPCPKNQTLACVDSSSAPQQQDTSLIQRAGQSGVPVENELYLYARLLLDRQLCPG